ncbi:MAG: inorganic phosphate transporter [Bacteroidales bacterium]
MEYYLYLAFVATLFILAISDLIVGVSNDAVNFLNSAFGSKASSRFWIFLVASLGIILGAVFSGGMMEVARKGIFDPQYFYFSEIMIIFLAVMITDVVLLDLFNTFGLPTSTTVSIVFELLGASVAMAMIKTSNPDYAIPFLKHINTSKAIEIIIGIFLSVFIAFTSGLIIQYLSRLVFSFKIEKTFKYFGGIFAGITIAAISNFLIMKGANELTFIPRETIIWLQEHMQTVLISTFIISGVIFQILIAIFGANVLRSLVLIGTFSLAMAFASNDLVNFIGVPLAGLSSFNEWVASGISPDSLAMTSLKESVNSQAIFLVIAGVLMVVTLISSKKAQSVVNTSLQLARQSEGEERFSSNKVSRFLVKYGIILGDGIKKFIPQSSREWIESRFQVGTLKKESGESPAFDMIRATVNLVVAAVLISIGTSKRLPLSTTYVTFMVAMGTSLADRAWDRESAVFRISGVATVIGGWFLTAFVAFCVAGVITLIIGHNSAFSNIMVFVLIAVAMFIVYRTQVMFRKKTKQKELENQYEKLMDNVVTIDDVYRVALRNVSFALEQANNTISSLLMAFVKDSVTSVKKAAELQSELQRKSKKAQKKIPSIIQSMEAIHLAEKGYQYVKLIDIYNEISLSLRSIAQFIDEHVSNRHKPLVQSQIDELSELTGQINSIYNTSLQITKGSASELSVRIVEVVDSFAKIEKQIDCFERNHVKRIKHKEVNTRNSIVYFNILFETRELLGHSVAFVKTYNKLLNNE